MPAPVQLITLKYLKAHEQMSFQIKLKPKTILATFTVMAAHCKGFGDSAVTAKNK